MLHMFLSILQQFSLKMGWITFQMSKSTVAYRKFYNDTSVFILLSSENSVPYVYVAPPWEQLLI